VTGLRPELAVSPPVSDDCAVRVLVADDDPRFRGLLSAVVACEPTLELVGAAADSDEAIAMTERLAPDVVLLDVAMPAGGGPRAAREIRTRSPRSRLLALSGSGERDAVLEMLRAGAIGYLVKGGSNSSLIEAIHRTARGEGDLSPEVTGEVLRELGGRLAREEDDAQSRAELAGRVDRVLRGDLLAMVFQPVVDLETGEVRGVEALARFPAEPVRGPAVWFAEAGEAGRLVELELAAIRKALDSLDELPDEMLMSFNASPATAVSPELADAISPRSGRRLVVEITEHAPVDDYDAVGRALDGLRMKGVRVAIDDAGAGFSSLRHILLLRPDVIKVDMTLTRGIEDNRPKRALARALISFAAEIGAAIIAEGIETPSEAAALRALGVRFGQGFHVGRPGPLYTVLGG
jgi:EAL domain-containing protein (putative c-di-GMP-specific phosphodiesterase class I)/ActR/RegA family two-component response regulator